MDLKDITQQNRQVHPWKFYKKYFVLTNSFEHYWMHLVCSQQVGAGVGEGRAWHLVRDDPHPSETHCRVLSITGWADPGRAQGDFSGGGRCTWLSGRDIGSSRMEQPEQTSSWQEVQGEARTAASAISQA